MKNKPCIHISGYIHTIYANTFNKNEIHWCKNCGAYRYAAGSKKLPGEWHITAREGFARLDHDAAIHKEPSTNKPAKTTPKTKSKTKNTHIEATQ